MTKQNDKTKWQDKMTRQNDKTKWQDKMKRHNDCRVLLFRRQLCGHESTLKQAMFEVGVEDCVAF